MIYQKVFFFKFSLFQDAHDSILEKRREQELSRVAVVIQRVMLGQKDRCRTSYTFISSAEGTHKRKGLHI